MTTPPAGITGNYLVAGDAETKTIDRSFAAKSMVMTIAVSGLEIPCRTDRQQYADL